MSDALASRATEIALLDAWNADTSRRHLRVGVAISRARTRSHRAKLLRELQAILREEARYERAVALGCLRDSWLFFIARAEAPIQSYEVLGGRR